MVWYYNSIKSGMDIIVAALIPYLENVADDLLSSSLDGTKYSGKNVSISKGNYFELDVPPITKCTKIIYSQLIYC